MKILVLDDSEKRLNIFKKNIEEKLELLNSTDYVKTAQEAIECLKKNLDYDYIFLDHDLEGRIFVPSSYHNTGYTVAKFISENDDIKINQIITHSMNPQGAQNIKTILPRAEIIPFNLLKTKL